jgi:hypothetical protein
MLPCASPPAKLGKMLIRVVTPAFDLCVLYIDRVLKLSLSTDKMGNEGDYHVRVESEGLRG